MTPPETLSDRSKALWREIVPRRCSHPEEKALLRSALQALDAADECRATIQREGMTVKTLSTGNVHRHPLVDAETSYRRLFLASWDKLNLFYVPNGGRHEPVQETATFPG
jgi:hypothetical protein